MNTRGFSKPDQTVELSNPQRYSSTPPFTPFVYKQLGPHGFHPWPWNSIHTNDWVENGPAAVQQRDFTWTLTWTLSTNTQ